MLTSWKWKSFNIFKATLLKTLFSFKIDKNSFSLFHSVCLFVLSPFFRSFFFFFYTKIIFGFIAAAFSLCLNLKSVYHVIKNFVENILKRTEQEVRTTRHKFEVEKVDPVPAVTWYMTEKEKKSYLLHVVHIALGPSTESGVPNCIIIMVPTFVY